MDIAETPPAAIPAGAIRAPGPALMARRFRGFLPVVVDVETGGFHSMTDALLEIAAVLIDITEDGALVRGATHSFHVQPFVGGHLDPAALIVNGIDPFHPLRPALPERDALQRVFREVRHALHAHGCTRAILVGHNAAFDLAFLNAAVARTGSDATIALWLMSCRVLGRKVEDAILADLAAQARALGARRLIGDQ